jgi:hypothetical protein
MKNSRLLQALLLAVLPIASQGLGSVPLPIPGATSNVTLALTISSETEGLTAKDSAGKALSPASKSFENDYTIGTTHTYEEGVKIGVAKYTTKEFLTDLKELGLLGEDTSISGWTVQKVQATSGTTLEDIQPGPVKFYLVKAGAAPVQLAGKIVINLFADIQARALKSTTKGENAPVLTYSATFKEVGSIELNVGSKEFHLNGMYTGTEKLSFLGAAKTPILASGAAKFTNLTGQLLPPMIIFGEGEGPPSKIVEGTVTLAPSKLVADLTSYPNVTIDDEDLEEPE